MINAVKYFFDRTVKRAPNSLPLSLDYLNFSNMTSRQCCVLCTLGKPHLPGDSMKSHQNNHKVAYRLIFYIFLKYLEV